MKRIIMGLWIALTLVVIGFGYVRLAPDNPSDWHLPPEVQRNSDLDGGVKRRIETDALGLQRLDAIIRATPRTEVLAGSVPEGMITYVTRSCVFGFPDYTTVYRNGDVLEIYGRLRFGRSDFGVNRARVERWLQTFQP
ncbi:DUF1499 domain-containing protein [Pseudodonghicola flavimaris]|uniref:DUF1499 domain-containing protein n=1 Tax=Pseudodonghicola flavimaris TaxID=3050036 RepID=A0ABT7EVK6_9RHOB|nr:DUF1499 domain-containing protein [Pseudodonghicola flavimaris]MDK3016377.1 DUF1499 domain-containing protein [Pseudodonghicola flavimaris]